MTIVGDGSDRDPDSIAIVDGDRQLTWREADELLRAAAQRLVALRLAPQERVAVFAENGAETLLLHVAGLLAGVSTVPVNFHLTPDEVAYILRDSGTRILFVDGQTQDDGTRAAALAGVPTVVGWHLGTPVDGVDAWDSWLDAAPAGQPSSSIRPRPNLMYTSGTTGFPKATELPPAMFPTADTVEAHIGMLRQNPLAACAPHLVVGPMYHTGPLVAYRMFATGVPVVILRRFDAERTLAAIAQHRVESTVMVPTHFKRLLDLPEPVRAAYDVSSLRRVVHTGSACPAALKRAMLDWWGPVLHEAYGGTEVGTVCAIDSEEWLRRPGSVGRPVAGMEVLVVDDDDKHLPPGSEGRLYFRDETGRGVVYHGNQDASRAAHLRPGVFTLGEVGYVDDDGYVFITDRVTDMVLSGGVNLYPAEAERVLLEHPTVHDAVVIGVPDDELGERLLALIVPEDPSETPSADEILAFCRDRLAAMKCPREITYVESLDRNSMGKINKRALRAQILEGAQ